jgi:hypothetical protein
MLTINDLMVAKCTTNPVDYTTANIGGAISAGPTFINGTSANELFFPTDPNAAGGATLIQTNKFFVRNGSSTDTAYSCAIWIENALDDNPSNNNIKVVSDNASDNSSYFARIIGFNNSGNPVQIDVTMNGTTEVTTSSQINTISRVESRASSNEALTPTNGNWTIKNGTTVLGILPYGLRTATTEYSILMEAATNGSSTIANTTANPTGTFFRPRTEAGALAFYADLSHISGPNAQPIWARRTTPAATFGSERVDLSFGIKARVI